MSVNERFAECVTPLIEPPGDRPHVESAFANPSSLGDRSHVYLRVNGIEKPVVVSTSEVDRALIARLGKADTVWLSWPEDAVVLLDADLPGAG